MLHSSPTDAKRAYRAGFIAVCGSFFIWGLLPLYLKPLHHISALAIGATRTIMACLFTMLALAVRSELASIRRALAERATRWRLTLSSLLISFNWVIYAWGVAHGHVIDTSLGYFINPLVNVLLGVAVLHERLNARQWLAVSLAALGVGYLTWMGGEPPWLALGLALSFGYYGLIRKITPVAPLAGLATEMLLISPVALGVLIFSPFALAGSFEHGPLVDSLLILSGPFTAVPLVMFAFGAQRIPYTTVGMLQYIGPTLQLLLGILLYREPFAGERVLGFCLIWLALLIYAGDGVWRSRASKPLLRMD